MCPKARKMLADYAGYSRGKYTTPKEFDDVIFSASLQRFKDRPLLQRVLFKAGAKCPPWLQKLAGELSRGNPTCGLFQITGDNEGVEVTRILRKVANSDYTELNSNLELIEQFCPILKEFIKKRRPYVSQLLGDLLDNVWAPFESELPQGQFYDSPESYHDITEVFPNNHQIRGSGNYDADRANVKSPEECNKETKRNPNLTSGIFTVYCPHGICLGFQLMDSPESPKTPFDLLVRRFPTVPRLIIYDNACNLHLYALKREPRRFMNTRFMVDRWHSKNHVCTQGYSMKAYPKDPNIDGLNSQICEQLNSQLRRLGTQLAFMHPENAIYLVKIFLAIRNMDKLKKLDLYAPDNLEI